MPTLQMGATQISSKKLRALQAQIGFIHQRFALIPNVRVIHNVLAGRLGAQGLFKSTRMFLAPPSSVAEEVYAVLKEVGIPEKIFERTDTLSGGQMQRVAIARALYQGAKVLLADEPVSSVDPARARYTLSFLRELTDEHGLTLVVSIHNTEFAKEFFPRIVGLKQGRVVFDSRKEDITEEQLSSLYALEEVELLA